MGSIAMTSSGRLDEPRVVHYLFAHRAVPRAFLRDPAPVMGILASDDGMRFLAGMLDILDAEVDTSERIDRSAIHLACYPLREEAFAAVVTMPPPLRVFEAWFVGLVARFGDAPVARAFALELAGPPGHDSATKICEWDAEGKFVVVEDDGCAPDVSTFVAAIEGLVARGEGPAPR